MALCKCGEPATKKIQVPIHSKNGKILKMKTVRMCKIHMDEEYPDYVSHINIRGTRVGLE